MGMINSLRDTSLPVLGLADAVNVDIRQDGTAVTRVVWEQVLSDSAHSLFQHDDRVFAVVGGNLCELDPTGATPLTAVSGRLSWDVFDGRPVFADSSGVYLIHGSTVTRYTSDAHAGVHDLDDPTVDMPGGHWLSYWNGRFMVANGSNLLFSEPMRYGAHKPMKGYIMLQSRPEWVAALETGFFVGLKDQVLFFRGSALETLEQRVVAAESAPGMALVVTGKHLSDELANFPRVAVFFTSSGFTIGLPNGNVLYPQAEKLKNLPLFRGRLMQSGNRIFAIRGF